MLPIKYHYRRIFQPGYITARSHILLSINLLKSKAYGDLKGASSQLGFRFEGLKEEEVNRQDIR